MLAHNIDGRLFFCGAVVVCPENLEAARSLFLTCFGNIVALGPIAEQTLGQDPKTYVSFFFAVEDITSSLEDISEDEESDSQNIMSYMIYDLVKSFVGPDTCSQHGLLRDFEVCMFGPSISKLRINEFGLAHIELDEKMAISPVFSVTPIFGRLRPFANDLCVMRGQPKLFPVFDETED